MVFRGDFQSRRAPPKILPYLLESVLLNLRMRTALQLDVIGPRHQVAVLRRTRPVRVSLARANRILWLLLGRLRPSCLDAVVMLQPETVIRWHRKGLGLAITPAR